MQQFRQSGAAVLVQQDYDSLKSNSWLNDSVVSAYFQLLASRDDLFHANEMQQCGQQSSRKYAFVSNGMHLLKLIREDPSMQNLPRYLRWLRRNRCSEADWIYVPVNISNTHWVLLLVDILQHSISLYDPFKYPARDVTSSVRLFKNLLLQAGQYVPRFQGEWKVVPLRNDIEIVQQLDSWNCGVFICAYCDAHSNREREGVNISYHDISRLRQLMVQHFKTLL